MTETPLYNAARLIYDQFKAFAREIENLQYLSQSRDARLTATDRRINDTNNRTRDSIDAINVQLQAASAHAQDHEQRISALED